MTDSTTPSVERHATLATIAWLWVLLPFLYGVWQLLIKVVPLFTR